MKNVLVLGAGQSATYLIRYLLERAEDQGWFVTVGTLLDYLLKVRGHHEITHAQRRSLERRWLIQKLLVGTT